MDITGVLSSFASRLPFVGRYFRVSPPAGNPDSTKYVNNNPPVYPDAKASVFVKKGYSGNASVYTIVTKAAKKFGHITRGVYDVKDEKAFKKYSRLCKAGLSTKGAMQLAIRLRNKAYNSDITVKNKLSDLLDRPNKWQGQDSFFELAKIFYMTTGEAFLWLNRGDVDDNLDDDVVAKMPVLELYVLPSQSISIIPDLSDPWEVLGYWFEVFGTNGARWRIRKCDIIHWKMPNPNFDGGTARTHLRGMAPLHAGNKVLTQDEEITDAEVAMYQNGGAKAIIYESTKAKMTPEQETQLKEVMDRKVNNSGMKAAVAAMQGTWGMLDLGLSSVEMELVQAGEMAFVRLCNLFDVPAALFLTDQTYENKAAAVKDWLTNSVIPAACSLRDEMNRVLLPAFNLPANIKIDNDISDIPELQEDLGKMVTWLALMPWLTPNEKREYLGEDQSTEEGMDEIWIPNNLVKLSDAGMPDLSAELDSQDMNDYNTAVDAGETGKAKPPKKLNGAAA